MHAVHVATCGLFYESSKQAGQLGATLLACSDRRRVITVCNDRCKLLGKKRKTSWKLGQKLTRKFTPSTRRKFCEPDFSVEQQRLGPCALCLVEFLRVTRTRRLGKLRVRGNFHGYLTRGPALFRTLFTTVKFQNAQHTWRCLGRSQEYFICEDPLTRSTIMCIFSGR